LLFVSKARQQATLVATRLGEFDKVAWLG